MDKEEYNNKSKKKRNNIGITICLIVFIVTILGLVLFFSTRGKTTTSGNYPDNVSDESLTCSGENIDYPFFTYDNAIKKTAEIKALFSNNELKSIALTYSLYYNDAQSITASEAHSHAAMNKSFGEIGLNKADAYNAKYAKMEDRMQMNLYTTANDFNNTAKRYFLFETDEELPDTIEGYQAVYKTKGLNCKIIKN